MLRQGGQFMSRKSTLSRRGRFVVAGALVVALAATGGVASVFQQVLDPSTAWIDCGTGEVGSAGEAGAIARHCGHQVEVLGDRTPWRTSFANSDGTTTSNLYAVPQQTNVSGEWEPIDPTLSVDEQEGDLDVESPVFDMDLSNGGTAGDGDPLGIITREDEFFKVGFPLDLPTPTVDGRRAIYDLADGVRLASTVNLDTTGFNSVVELRDRASAERFFELLSRSASPQQAVANGSGKRQIAYSAQISSGLRYETTETGTILVVNEEAEPRFMVSTPLMWDSATTSVDYIEGVSEVNPIDRLSAPGGSDKISQMPMSVADDAIVVTIDEGMVADPATVWPIYVDPPWGGHGAASRAAVRTGGYNGTLWNWENADNGMRGEGTGYCSDWNSCNTQFRQRLAWQFEGIGFIGGLNGADVKSATFNVYLEHSATCQNLGTRVWITGAIWPGMSWNDLGWEEMHGTRDESACNGNKGWKEYDIVGVMKKVANSNGNQITLGLKPDDDSTMNTWKRFLRDASISVVYNRPPDAPVGQQLTDPSVTSCVTGSGRPAIANSQPVMSAIASDPDGGNISTKFQIRQTNTTSISWDSGWSAGQASGSRFSTRAAARTSGIAYAWRAVARDDANQETASGWCEFLVDTTKPTPPSISTLSTSLSASSSDTAVYEEGKERGAVGRQGSFTFSNNGATDVVSYRYGFNDPAAPNSVASGSIVRFVPSTAGPVTLYVQSQDRAGNLSNFANYKFVVGAAIEDIVWSFDEGTGTTAWGDSDRSADKTLDLKGPTWVDGPHALFGSRPGDRALDFDGVDDWASAPGVIDAQGPYAISVHVKLDPEAAGTGKYYTILTQEGAKYPAFLLFYNFSCFARNSQVDKGCWSFSTVGDDQGRAIYTAESPLPVVTGQWVHLVAAYDPAAGKASIWQCDVGTPEVPSAASPVLTRVSASGKSSAASSLVIGRSLGASPKFWPGLIDNVRVFRGQVIEESKIRRLCQGAEATDFTEGNIALDPTEKSGQ